MFFLNEIQIKILFRNDSEMREQLLSGNVDMIRKIGRISQKEINPEDIVIAFESNDPNIMNYLYNQSKRLVQLQELYRELCYEFCKNMVDDKTTEYSTEKNRSV